MAETPSWLSQYPEVENESWLDQYPEVKEKPFLDISETASALGRAATSLATTVPSSLSQAWSGLDNPWKRSEGYLQSQQGMRDLQEELAQSEREAELSGDASTVSTVIRGATPSLGFTGATLGPSLAAGAGTLALTRSPNAARGAAAATSAIMAYRMAGAQFLDDAKERIDAYFQENLGRLPNEQEQNEAYDELLPLARKFGAAEAGPEALGNLALGGAGKYIRRALGGKGGVMELASNALGKVTGTKAALAGAGALASEIGTEAVTAVEQGRINKQFEEGVMRGEAPESVQLADRSLQDYVEGFKEVAPTTTALTAMMGAAGLAPTAISRGIRSLKKPVTQVEEEPEISMQSPEIALKVGEASAANLAATGNAESAIAQDDFNQAAAEVFKKNEPAVQPVEEVETPEPEVTPYEPTTDTRPEILPENLPNLEGDPFAEEETPVSEQVTPLSEGAERNRALIAEAYAKFRGKAPKDLSAGLQAAIPQQAPQENALPIEIPNESLLREKRPEMELQGMGEQNAQPEEVATEGRKEKVTQPLRVIIPEGATPFKKGSLSEQLSFLTEEANDAFQVHGARSFQDVLSLLKGAEGEVQVGKMIPPPNGNPFGQTKTGRPYLVVAKKGEDGIGDAGTIAGVVINAADDVAPRFANERKTLEKAGVLVWTPREYMQWANAEVASKPENRVESRTPEETSAGDQLLRPATSEEEVITQPGEPTTATEGMVTPGGVATERDLTKPEQMTPREVKGKKVPQFVVHVSREGGGPMATGHTRMDVMVAGEAEAKAEIEKMRGKGLKGSYRATGKSYNLEDIHRNLVEDATMDRKSVSSSAVDTYGIKLPEGYVKRGDLYVFQPQTTKAAADNKTEQESGQNNKKPSPVTVSTQTTAAETQTPESVGRGLGGSRGVQSEPSEGSIPEVAKVSTETESESSGKITVADEAMRDLEDSISKLPEKAQSKWTPEVMGKARDFYASDDRNQSRLDGLTQIQKNKVYDSLYRADKVAADEQDRVEKAQKARNKEIEKEEREAAKKEAEMLKREEMRSKAIDSIIGKGERQKRKFGQVTNSDAIAAVAMLVSSKDIPGVLTTWWGTKEDFLRDPANRIADQEIYDRIKAGELVEGFFNKGRAYVFLDGIGVSENDMLRGEQMEVSPQIAAVRRVLLHESLVHRGIHGLPLRHRRKILNWVKENSTPKQLDDLAKLYTEYSNWRNSEYQFEALAEEFLAKQVDSLTEIPKDGPMAKLMDILRQIWNFIVGYKREPTLSDLKSVIKLLKSGAEALTNDTLKDGGGVKLSYAGEKAIDNLPEERRQFMRDSLDAAKAMAAAGKSSEEIRAATGWFPGKYDGKMRWEVPDDKVSESLVGRFAAVSTTKESFEERDRRLYFSHPKNNPEFSVRPSKTSFFGKKTYEAFQRSLNLDRLLRYNVVSFLPEWQSLGKFATEEEAKAAIDLAKAEFEAKKNQAISQTQAIDVMLKDVLLHPELFSAYPELKNVRVTMTPAFFDVLQGVQGWFNDETNTINVTPYAKDKKSTLLHEVQHWIQKEEGFPSGSSPIQVFSGVSQSEIKSKAAEIANRIRDQKNTLTEYMRSRMAQLREATTEEEKAIANRGIKTISDWFKSEQKTLDDLESGDLNRISSIVQSRSGSDFYNRVAGEIEARDIQARKDFTQEQRAATAPYSSENITPEDAIVLFGSVPQASVQFSSETSAAFTAGSEAARSTLYSEREMDIREAIRRAYEATPKTNSVAVPIGELFAKTEELMPGITQDEFSNVLQDLFEDNGAVLQEGDVVEPLTEQDRRYLAAVESGDMEKAQRMVDEAAKAAGFNVGPVWHGSPSSPFTAFKPSEKGIFATDNEKMADAYGTITRARDDAWLRGNGRAGEATGKHSLFKLYASLRNPFVATDSAVAAIGVSPDDYKRSKSKARGIVAADAKENGHDGIIIPRDAMLFDLETQSYVVFSPSQIKSADPVTRDDAGNVIPLSRRFDTGADIRGQINVTTPEGKPAGFVVVMPRGAKASKIPMDSEASKRFKDDIAAIENGSFKAKFGGVQFKDFPASERTVKPKEFYSEAAIRFVDNELDKGNSIEDIAFSIQSPDFLESLGIENNLSAQDAVTIEVRNRVNEELRQEEDPKRKKRLDKMNKRLSGYWQGTGSKAGANLGIRKHLINDPRYRWMFIKDLAEKGIAESVENVARGNMDSPEGFTNKANAEGDKADAQSNEQTADKASGLADDVLMEEGEALLNEENKGIWNSIKNWLRQLAILARIDAEDVKTGSKASKTENEEFYVQMKKLSKEERQKKRDEIQNNINKALKKLKSNLSDAEKASIDGMVEAQKKRGPRVVGTETKADLEIKSIMREMNKARPGQKPPLSKQISWKQIFSQKAKTVEEYRQRIFDAISSNEAFQNLPDDKKTKLADLFSKAWESKRKDILERMLTTLINQEEAAKRISKEGAKALREQRMKLVEDINLGILDAEEVMKRLAEKFGIKTEFTEQERQKIDSLIETVQDETLNRVKRNKAAYELLKTLSGDVKIPVVKMLADYWVASVLSGMNTATSIALAVGNGAFELLSGVYRVLTAGVMNPKDVPAEIMASFKAMAAFLKAFKREGRLAWQYLVTGDREFLDPSMNDVLNDLNYESIGRSTALAEKMAESDKIAQKVMGVWMRSVSRLLTALDSFNAGVTKTGSLPIVARQLDLNADGIAKIEQAMNLQNYKDIIIERDFAGIPPKTQHEKAVLDSWAKDEMMAELDKYGKFSENANFYGQQGAMTLEPSGLGGFFYRAIKSLTGAATTGADKFLAESQRKWKQAENADKAFQALQLGLAYFLQFGAHNSANLAGLRFARFAGNKFNQGLSFLPGIGMLRYYEASLDKTHIEAEEAFTDMLLRNQLAGTILALAGYAMLQAISDEPDDEKRGWFINGSWANLTPEKKQQKLAAGQKEFTIGIGDKVFSYQNWPISSALAAIGGLSDLIRFSPEQWNEKNAVSRLTSAATSGVFAATEIPALSGFQTLFGNNLSSKDPNEKKLDRFANVMAGWGGGFVPRILKDFDYLAEPELRKYETLWEKTASHIPVYRRYEGKEYYDILGKQIERKIYPGSREFMEKPSDPEYQVLGKLNSRGIWLTPANAEYRMVGKGRNRRRLTQEEADAYSLETGKGYRQMLLRYGQRALQMPTERARAFLQDKADEVRDRALKKVYRR